LITMVKWRTQKCPNDLIAIFFRGKVRLIATFRLL